MVVHSSGSPAAAGAVQPATPRPAAVDPPSFSFAAAGDHAATADSTASLAALARSDASFYLGLGDFSYNMLQPESSWCDYVKSHIPPGFPFELISGNHDAGKNGLIDRFAACLPDRIGAITGTYGKEYYFDYPPANPMMRVILISPSLVFPGEAKYSYTVGTSHYQWVSDAIDQARAAGTPWVVVGMARLCISMGTWHCNITPDLFNLLVQKKVDLILQAHDHDYQRSKQLALGPSCPAIVPDSYNPACVVDDGADGSYVKGAGSLVVIDGTFGNRNLYDVSTADPEAGYFASWMGNNLGPRHGFMHYRVSEHEIAASFTGTSPGAFTDSFSVVETPSAGPLPAGPLPVPGGQDRPGPDAGGPAAATPSAGYRTVASDGGVFAFGDARFHGSAGDVKLAKPIVGMAATPTGRGYWLVASDGGIFAFGDATFHGSTGDLKLAKPIVGMAATPTGKGYWLVASDGGIFAFGDATFFGSTGDLKLAKPIVTMAATPTGLGYWLVASDGGVFTFGDARFHGSAGDVKLAKPIVGMAATPSGKGYWLVASDGRVFTFGDATFHGSTGAIELAKPIVGMAATPSGNGYWLVASDGGIFAFGDATFHGSTGDIKLAKPIVGMTVGVTR